MSDNVESTVELKQQQWDYLEEMAKKHNLPDKSKALRVLINFAMQETSHEDSIYTEIRCTNC